MSPADLAFLRRLISERWPDVALSHGLRHAQAFAAEAPCGALLYATLGYAATPRALHTLADVLEDADWVVRRDGDDIYVTGREPVDMTDAERRARLEWLIADRAERRKRWAQWMRDAAREHGARVAAMTRRSKW